MTERQEGLRDRFAMAALTGLLARRMSRFWESAELAGRAYELADIMLQVRAGLPVGVSDPGVKADDCVDLGATATADDDTPTKEQPASGIDLAKATDRGKW
jgi:hypothetical protein